MVELSLERHVPHLPERMFALVSDLADYPNFVPNCQAMQVRPGADGSLLARMTIKFGPLTQAYTSRVNANPRGLTITADAVDGPFRHLRSRWSFEPEGQGTLVRFDIDFKFANPLVAAVAEPAFAAKQDEIVDSFVEEAGRRFG